MPKIGKAAGTSVSPAAVSSVRYMLSTYPNLHAYHLPYLTGELVSPLLLQQPSRLRLDGATVTGKGPEPTLKLVCAWIQWRSQLLRPCVPGLKVRMSVPVAHCVSHIRSIVIVFGILDTSIYGWRKAAS